MRTAWGCSSGSRVFLCRPTRATMSNCIPICVPSNRQIRIWTENKKQITICDRRVTERQYTRFTEQGNQYFPSFFLVITFHSCACSRIPNFGTARLYLLHIADQSVADDSAFYPRKAVFWPKIWSAFLFSEKARIAFKKGASGFLAKIRTKAKPTPSLVQGNALLWGFFQKRLVNRKDTCYKTYL